jgi:hypothetical protein
MQTSYSENTQTIPQTNSVERVTALWALSEAALGGALHAFKIPFTGLFIGGSAVLFITLIFFLSEKRGAILKATILVMIVKALVSPHSPINAYISVAFQGICGEILFALIKNRKLAALLLGILSLLQSAFQKIFVVTLVFGKSIWEAIDLFGDFVIHQVFALPQNDEMISVSIILISAYIGLHLIGGVFFGIWASRLAGQVTTEIQNSSEIYRLPINEKNVPHLPVKSARRIWKKISLILIFSILLFILIYSYLHPGYEKNTGYNVMIMIIRSIVIMLIWIHLIGPFLLRKLRHYLNDKEMKYKAEVENILAILPLLRVSVRKSWQISVKYPRMIRLYFFMRTLIIYILCIDLSESE